MKGVDFDVKGLRQRLGITQVELATRLKVHPSAIARWERGVSKPQPAYAERLQALERRAEREEKGKAAA